jgi:hypothetical protein
MGDSDRDRDEEKRVTYRVVQWATGGDGTAAIARIEPPFAPTTVANRVEFDEIATRAGANRRSDLAHPGR